MACEAQLLTDVALFEHLEDADREQLAGFVHERRLDAGETLFRTGEPGESLYVVSTGEVELFIKDTAGQKILLALAGAGEVFGELALLDQGPRTATALAIVETHLLSLKRDDLLLLFQ